MKVAFNNLTTTHNDEEKELTLAMRTVLRSGWYVLGQQVTVFEKEFAQYLGVKHCIGVANGLEALQISLQALDISTGDEVITTPLSAFATTLAIELVGARPIFVDTDEYGSLDVNLIKKAVTKQTRAILPVHIYGNAAAMSKLIKLADNYSLPIVEDAAQAHGATYYGHKLGSFGKLGCFSFYPTKNLGALGDGGAVVTDSEELAKKCRMLRDYGQSSKYSHTHFGLNSRLDELQAAILRVKLRRLDHHNKLRKKTGEFYKKFLKNCKQVRFISPRGSGNGHLVVIRTHQRDELQAWLRRQGVETQIHYPTTIPDQPVYKKKFATLEIPKARRLASEVLSLPSYPNISTLKIKFVSEKIIEYFK